MGSLVSGEICSVRGPVLGSQMVSSGASHFVANETFVVLDVFSMLGGGEIDPIYVHCHRVLSVFLGARGDIISSAS